ncbi:MAG TPA: MFS transporter [Planctomycetaceae bacterium]|nr:MFS transporter [Planctomycetaceae bacterium]
MGIVCLFLPTTPPAATGEIPIVKALAMLGDPNFLVFIVVSMAVTGLMQFYFLGTAQFLQDKGIGSEHVPGSMALAQIAQAVATWFLFMLLITRLGYKRTLAIGALCWCLLYAVYVMGKPPALLIAVQPFHGLAYVLFVIVGQKLVNDVSPEDIRSSMQALIFAVTTGIGLFLGTQFAGFVMDTFTQDGAFQWQKVWLVPCLITLAGVLALVFVFKEPAQSESA